MSPMRRSLRWRKERWGENSNIKGIAFFFHGTRTRQEDVIKVSMVGAVHKEEKERPLAVQLSASGVGSAPGNSGECRMT